MGVSYFNFVEILGKFVDVKNSLWIMAVPCLKTLEMLMKEAGTQIFIYF